MRNLFLIIAIFATTVVLGQENAMNNLTNIQRRIKQTFGQAFQKQNPSNLIKLEKELADIYKQKKQNIVQYWRAYSQYHLAIYYFVKKNKDKSEEEIDKAVDLMENIKNKTSEDYALLALCQGFAKQFKNLFTKMSLSSTITDNAKKAISKDDQNIRGYYTYASNDFYRPEKFGGGKEVEKYLLKALSLPVQKVKNPYLPSWGKEEAYEMIIKWYIRKQQNDKAKLYFDEATAKYPNNRQLQHLGTKINK